MRRDPKPSSRPGRISRPVKRASIGELPADAKTRAALERFLREARDAAGGRLGPVVVFGSVARGQARVDSDVDLLVVWDGSAWEALKVLSFITNDILFEMGVYITPHPVSPQRFAELHRVPLSFYENVEREGLLVEG